MFAFLKWSLPDGTHGRHLLDPHETTTIGRNPQSTLCLSHASISRKHALVLRVGQSWMVRDAGSTNQVLIDGQAIDEQILRPGMIVAIGQATLQLGPSRPCWNGRWGAEGVRDEEG